MKTIQLGGGGGMAEYNMQEEGMHQFKLIIIYCIIPSRDRQWAISSITVMEEDHQHSPSQKSTGQPNKNRIYVFYLKSVSLEIILILYQRRRSWSMRSQWAFYLSMVNYDQSYYSYKKDKRRE